MPRAEVEALRRALGSPSHTGSGFAVWPGNWKAVQAFLAVDSQWRTMLAATENGLSARFLGLDYAAADVAWARLGMRLSPHDFSKLQLLERAASAALNGP